MDFRWNEADARRAVERWAPQYGEAVALRLYSARLIGSEPDLVLHGGGNVSVKGEYRDPYLGDSVEAIYVKASGFDLATLAPAGLPGLDLAYLRRLRRVAGMTDAEMAGAFRAHAFDADAPTPSIETLVHAFLPHKFVDHSHADAVLVLTNQPDGEAKVREALAGAGVRVGVLPYVHPGFDLAQAVAAAYEADPAVEALVLMQHGLITFADDAAASYDCHLRIVSACEAYIRRRAEGFKPRVVFTAAGDPAERAVRAAPILRGLLAAPTGDEDQPHRPMIMEWRATDEVLAYVNSVEGRRLADTGPLTADHVIRTGPRPMWCGTGFQPVSCGTGFQPVSCGTGFQPVESVADPAWDDDDRLTQQLRNALDDYRRRMRDYLALGSASPRDAARLSAAGPATGATGGLSASGSALGATGGLPASGSALGATGGLPASGSALGATGGLSASGSALGATGGLSASAALPSAPAEGPAGNAESRSREGLDLPRVVLLPGCGAMCWGRTKREARVAADIVEHTLAAQMQAEAIGRFVALPDADLHKMHFRDLQQAKLAAHDVRPLAGRVVVISGGAGAIGSGVARVCIRAGAHVVVADLDAERIDNVVRRLDEIDQRQSDDAEQPASRSPIPDPRSHSFVPSAEALPDGRGSVQEALPDGPALTPSPSPGGRGEIAGHGSARALGVVMDVTDETSVRAGFDEICRRFGGVDVIVANAGIAHVSAIADMDIDRFRRVMEVNAVGYLIFIREGVRVMKAQGIGGHIIVNASKNVFAPGREFAAYGASKAAAHQLGRVAALELAEHNIRVNMINADAVFDDDEDVPSGLWSHVGPDRAAGRGLKPEDLPEYYRRRNLLHARVRAEHVGRAVVFFASNATPTTGATLPIDGGIPEAFPR